MRQLESHEKMPQSRIIIISKNIREASLARVKIGVAGNGGSFSEQAAIQYATEEYTKQGNESIFAVIEVVWLITAEAVLSALEAREVDMGIFAVMNNHGGAVRENLGAMAEHRWRPAMSDDGLPETVTLPVRHMFMTRPGSEGNDIHTIVTQLQAHEQCKRTIQTRWPNAKVMLYDDTATAAKDLADGSLIQRLPGISLENTAVVGPEGCASLNNLSIGARDLQDHQDNTTTFVVALPYKNNPSDD